MQFSFRRKNVFSQMCEREGEKGRENEKERAKEKKMVDSTGRNKIIEERCIFENSRKC